MYRLRAECRFILDSFAVIRNEMIAPDFCKITFAAPAIAQKAEPGQFCMIYMPSDRGFMLPRPLSIFSADRTEGKLSFFYKKVGRGTKYLSQTEPGSYLKLLGPLGNSFPPAESGALMVAGGMGLAPLAFLISSSTVPLTLIHAAKTAEELVSPLAEVPTAEVNIVAVTEDGSEGRRGSALDIACEYLPGTKTLYACGPTAMLQSLAQVCRSRGIQAWLSLEEKMACGIGACRGCSVQTNSGYSRVCHDGPVFSAGEVYPDA